MPGLKCSQAGVMANSQALIPLIGITPDSILFMANAYIYILHVMVVFHLPPSLFGFLHNYLFIYLQYIIPTDYILTVSNTLLQYKNIKIVAKLNSTMLFIITSKLHS